MGLKGIAIQCDNCGDIDVIPPVDTETYDKLRISPVIECKYCLHGEPYGIGRTELTNNT